MPILSWGRRVNSLQRKSQRAVFLFDCDKKNIFFASTGVIGEQLPYTEIINKFDYLKENLSYCNFEVHLEQY